MPHIAVHGHGATARVLPACTDKEQRSGSRISKLRRSRLVLVLLNFSTKCGYSNLVQDSQRTNDGEFLI
jgi:hypothetical protein